MLFYTMSLLRPRFPSYCAELLIAELERHAELVESTLSQIVEVHLLLTCHNDQVHHC